MQIIDEFNNYKNCKYNSYKSVIKTGCCGGKGKTITQSQCSKLSITTNRLICANCQLFKSK